MPEPPPRRSWPPSPSERPLLRGAVASSPLPPPSMNPLTGVCGERALRATRPRAEMSPRAAGHQRCYGRVSTFRPGVKNVFTSGRALNQECEPPWLPWQPSSLRLCRPYAQRRPELVSQYQPPPESPGQASRPFTRTMPRTLKSIVEPITPQKLKPLGCVKLADRQVTSPTQMKPSDGATPLTFTVRFGKNSL